MGAISSGRGGRASAPEGASQGCGESQYVEPDEPFNCDDAVRETYLSGPGLARDYAAHGGDPSFDAKQIVTYATQGDALAEAATQRYLDRFGRALSVVINILDPDVVVLGGGMSNIARLYAEGRARVEQYVFNDELRTQSCRTCTAIPPACAARPNSGLQKTAREVLINTR
jgi:predicted NBD/HSP70 family sugar kinase